MAEEIVKRRGLLKKHAAVDYEVWQWKTMLEQSRDAKRVTKTEVQAYAIQAYKNAGVMSFKASDGWYRRWRVRWTKPGIIKMKEMEGEEGIKKKNESKEKIKNCSKTDKTERTSLPNKCNNYDTSKFDESLKSSLNKTDDKTIELRKNLKSTEKKTESDEDCVSSPNQLQIECVHNVNTPKHGQRQSSRMQSSGVSSEISKEIQLKSKKAGVKVLRDSTISNLKDVNLLDSTKTYLNNETSHVHNETSHVHNETSHVHNENVDSEPNLKNSTLQNDICSDSGNSDTLHVKDSSHNPSCVSEKNNTLAELNSSQKNCTNLEVFVGLQCNNGIYLPSTSANLETFTIDSSLLNQRDLDFGDHEFFCDFCEDFHPRQNSFDALCCKQKQDSSFLRSVFEKKDFNTITNTPQSNLGEEKTTKKTIIDRVEDKRLKNPSVLFSKGKRYLIQFKSKVVNYALNHNAKQAAAVFKVNRGTVSEWLDERRRSSSCAASKSKSIKRLLSPEDKEFLSWLESSKFNITNELIKQRAEDWLRLEGGSDSKCEWLRMYANRLNGTEDDSIKKKYIMYPEAFKRMVVFHAQTHSNMAAARVFGVARRRVVQWQETCNDQNIKKDTSASNVTDESVDKRLFEWFSSQDPPPTGKQVRCKGLELYNAAGYRSIQCGAQWYYRWRMRHKLPPARDQLHQEVPLLSWVLTQLDNNQCVTHVELAQAYTDLTNAKVSRGWTFRFCRKHYRLLQSVPDPSTALPPPLERQVASFLETLHDTIQKGGFKDTDIIAMDEVPLHFLSLGRDSTKKPLLIRRSGFESCQASLIVSSLADGTLLPTMFVVKGAAPTSSSESCVVHVANDSSLISEDMMTQWITSVCSNQLQGQQGLLITDCFDTHTSKGVQQVMADHKLHHAVIPGGFGFKLMPISAVCQLFKTMLEDMFQVSLTSQSSALTSPSHDQLYLWCVRVHKHLAKYQKENIKAAFKDLKIFPQTC